MSNGADTDLLTKMTPKKYFASLKQEADENNVKLGILPAFKAEPYVLVFRIKWVSP